MAIATEEAKKSKDARIAISNDKNGSEYLQLSHSVSNFTFCYQSKLESKKTSFPSIFYFMRHAETDAHNEKLICGGDWDIPINKVGESSARQAAEDFYKSLRSIKTIVTSPLLRARQTAEILSAKLQIPVKVLEGLREWRLGDWEKRPFESVPDLFTRTDDPPNGESRLDFNQRIENALRSCAEFEGPVLIMGHGAVWYSMLKLLKIQSQYIPNCLPFCFEKFRNCYQLSELSKINIVSKL